MPPTLYAGVKFVFKKGDSYAITQTDRFKAFIQVLNNTLRNSLANPFKVKSGEVEGFFVIQEASKFAELILLVDLEFNAARPRYALGVGSLSTNLKYDDINVDGPLLKTVNRALKTANLEDKDVFLRLPSPFLTRTINTLFSIESDLRNDWSAAHREAIKLARQGLTQVEIAEALGVTQAAISQRLKHARWERYLEITMTIQEFLSQVRWKTLLPWDIRKEEKRKRKKAVNDSAFG